MELHDMKKSLQSFVQDEHSESEPAQFSHSRLSSASLLSLYPSSPGGSSPWTLSPPHRQQPPSPSLLYHCLATLQRHDGNILSLAVSRGLIFTGSDSDRIRIWHQPDCTDRGHIRTHHPKIHAMLSHGKTLFTAHRDCRVRAWSISSDNSDRLRSKKLATLPPKPPIFSFSKTTSPKHRDTITCLALYHAENLLYTGSLDKTVQVWKLSTTASPSCVDSFTAHSDQINAMVVDQRDGWLFTGSSEGSVKVWRRVYGDYSHAVIMVLRLQSSSPVNALAISPTSCFLYSGSSDGQVSVWEKEGVVSAKYQHRGFLEGHQLAVLCLAAAARVVVSGSEDTSVRVWRREEGTDTVHVCLAVMEGHRGPVRCVAVSVEVEGEEGEGLLLYSASLDRMLKVWRVKVVGKERGQEEERWPEVAVGYKMSPVLSPLWVEKRIQARC